MSVEITAMHSSRSGGFVSHSSFLTPGLQRPELKLLRTRSTAGQLSSGSQYWLPTADLPSEEWLSPAELPTPFRLYNMLEDQMKWYTANFADTVVPRELLRSHLQEVLTPTALTEHTSCLGNRMAACQIGSQALLFTCTGKAGQTVTLSVLDTTGNPLECVQQQQLMTSKPIHQLAASHVTAQTKQSCQQCAGNFEAGDAVTPSQQLHRSSEAGHASSQASQPHAELATDAAVHHSSEDHTAAPESVLLAIRGPYQILIVLCTQLASKWVLQPVATVHSKQAVQHVAWNPFNPMQAAFVCEDGSVNTLTVTAQPHCSFNVKTATLVPAGHALNLTSSARSCTWTHPRRLVCSSGRNLVRCELLGKGQSARVVLLHSRPEGDDIVALASSGCNPVEGPMVQASNYLAVSTLKHILLFDTRRCSSPLLCWAHGMDSEPPQLLHLLLSSSCPGRAGQEASQTAPGAFPSSLQGSSPWDSQPIPDSQSQPWAASQAGANHTFTQQHWGSQNRPFDAAWPATQASQGPQAFAQPTAGQQGNNIPHFTGLILAGSLALGTCKALRFRVTPSDKVITAYPLQDSLKRKSQRGLRANWGLIEAQHAFQHATDVDEFGQDRVEPNFTWSLSLINAVQATELPRIVCKPLKEMSDVSKGAPLVDMAEVHGEEAERMILQCPDLQGMALLPSFKADTRTQCEADEQSRPDFTLLRASFVGDFFLDSCFFFHALPAEHAAEMRRQRAAPHRIALPAATGQQAAEATHSDKPQEPMKAIAEQRKAGRPWKQIPKNCPEDSAAEVPSNGGDAGQPQTLGPGESDLPARGPPDGAAAPMYRHLDIRQTAENYYARMRIKHADPRWQTDKNQVRFAQKGLFKVDVSVHHAMMTQAIRNYHKVTPSTPAGNQWGFADMQERIESLQINTEATNSIPSPGADQTDQADTPSLLANLQGAVTADELAARQRWTAGTQANVAGSNEPAIPSSRFKFPDKSAVTSRALQMVLAAHRKQADESRTATNTAVTDILASGIAVVREQVPGQNSGRHVGTRNIALAAWTGPRLGTARRRQDSQANTQPSPIPESQASVHLTQHSQSALLEDNADTIVPVVPTNRLLDGGHVISSRIQNTGWAGQPVVPRTWGVPLQMNSYYQDMEPGQEMDDIAALEKLWLEAHGQQTISGTPAQQQVYSGPSRKAHTQPAAQLNSRQVQQRQSLAPLPEPSAQQTAKHIAAPSLAARAQANAIEDWSARGLLAAPAAQLPRVTQLPTSQQAQRLLSPSHAAELSGPNAAAMASLPAEVQLGPVASNQATQGDAALHEGMQGLTTVDNPVSNPGAQQHPRSAPPAKRKRKQSFVEGF